MAEEYLLPQVASEVATAINKALSSVQSINGITPDRNGNVNINIPGSGGNVDQVILKSPDGTEWVIVVSNDGILSAVTKADQYDIFVIGGQSNVVGYGTPMLASDVFPDGTYQYTQNGNVEELETYPLDHIEAYANQIGFQHTFLDAYIADGKLQTGRKILLIPCGHPGTSFVGGRWEEGGDLHTAMLNRITAVKNLVGRNGVFKAILWHQGESDLIEGNTVTNYKAQLGKLIDNARAITGNIPFIMGEWQQDWLATYGDMGIQMQAVLSDIAEEKESCYLVSADGLTGDSKNGTIHFSAEAQRTFGERYYAGYKAVLNGGDVPDEPSVYTITNTLTNVTSNNSTTQISKGDSYTATLTPADGYNMTSVSVIMGDLDITSTAYSNGVISIESVTGDIAIIAVAKENVWTVTNNLTKVTNANTAKSVTKGASYTAVLTVAYGYELNSVTVTMGGADITGTAYDDGIISIAEVTGNVVITAVAYAGNLLNAATLFGFDNTETSGWNGDELVFDGVDDYATLPADTFDFGSGDFTIQMIAKDNGHNHVLLSQSNASHSDTTIQFFSATGPTFCYQVYFDDGSKIDATVPKNDNMNSLAIVRSGEIITLYLNDNVFCTENIGTKAVRSSTSPVTIGRWGEEVGRMQLPGEVKFISVANSALTADQLMEVASHYGVG